MNNIKVQIIADRKEIMDATINAPTLKDAIHLMEKPAVLSGIVVFDKVNDETGEIKTVYACKLDGEWFATISPTAGEFIGTLASAYDEKEIIAGMKVILSTGKSSKGREFLKFSFAK